MPGQPIKIHHNYGSDIIEEKPEEQLPKAPIIFDDPLNSFDRYPWKEQTDLGNWMSYSEETRQRKTKQYANDKRDMNRRHKNLCYIICTESSHPLQSDKVIFQAVIGLCPKQEEPLRDFIKQINAR